jgi:FlaA1/EpsC-like NDP-sugar epimerase
MSLQSLNSVSNLKFLPLPAKFVLLVVVDFVTLLLAMLAARILRVPFDIWPPENTLQLHLAGPFFSLIALFAIGFYRTASRGHSMRLEVEIAVSQVFAAGMWLIYLRMVGFEGFPRSIVGIYPVFATVFLSAMRRTAAYIMNPESRSKPHALSAPVLIFGAGPEAVALANALLQGGEYRPVAFVTTDYTLVGRRLNGMRVYDTEEIAEAKSRHRVRQILISSPVLPGLKLRQIFELMIRNGLSTKLVPNVNDVASGRVVAGAIRELDITDLLGREVVAPQRDTIDAAVGDRRILITGAGGSIGSELARQCLKYQAKELLLLDSSEFSLFEIHRELEAALQHHPDVCVVPLLGDVKSSEQMAEIFLRHKIDIVFHAAAYKHVRMVQENPKIGILNNVKGTIALAEAAKKAGVPRFVLISTDKAVRPTSVMGATKRLAEMVVQALASQPKYQTLFCMVRFGNVLGSNGSVVPIFKKQIAMGGPVTVTHPEVSRYFMAIPEAAELVLQAAGLAKSGEVMVLDMGEPVKIAKLARSMIELAGHTVKSEETPDGEIEVRFTGLKEGEKLYEELEIGNELSPTEHKRILSSKEFYLSWPQLKVQLDKMDALLEAGQTQKAVALLMELAGRSDQGAVQQETKLAI